MSRIGTLFFMAILGGAALSACQTTPASAPSAPAPVKGYVTDMKAFDAFIATRPNARDFQAAYPDVQLVMPDSITTMDFRMNNSRYFPEWDKTGRITGGKFQ